MNPLSDILLITDCDGTLLRDDKSISQKDLDAIARFRELGGNFTIATGRSMASMKVLMGQLHPDLPMILYNGSMVYDPVAEKPLWMTTVPQESHYAVKKAMEHYGSNLGVEILTPEGLFVIQYTPIVDAHLNGALKTEYQPASYEQMDSCRWLKVMFTLPAEDMDSFRAFLESLHVPGVRYVRSEKFYFEILPEEASKGSALKHLCALTGFSLNRTAAIGDCDNDVEMLQEAAAGYAVANAYPSVRAKARKVTVSNMESAVSAVIHEILTDSFRVFQD